MRSYPSPSDGPREQPHKREKGKGKKGKGRREKARGKAFRPSRTA